MGTRSTSVLDGSIIYTCIYVYVNQLYNNVFYTGDKMYVRNIS